MFHLRTRITRDELASCGLAYLLRVDGILLYWYILTHTFSVCVLEISIISVGVYSAVFKYFCNTSISGRSYKYSFCSKVSEGVCDKQSNGHDGDRLVAIQSSDYTRRLNQEMLKLNNIVRPGDT